MHSTHVRLLGAAAILASATMALAQPPAGYVSDFENLMASATGVNMWDPAQPAGTPGQDNYYWPAGTNSVPHLAFTYNGNSLGVPQNPGGGNVFIAGTGPASPTFARAQRDISYGCGSGRWTIGTDLLITFTGQLPSAQNIGSLSLQPFPGSQSFIMLARWTDPATAANWNADYVYFTAAGGQVTGTVPDPAFQNLNVNQWYRWETDIDLTTNQILAMRVIDLTTGNVIASHAPNGWFMLGGMGGSQTPTGFRFFAGGGVSGNTIAWDNPALTPGALVPIPGCTNPANSLTASGFARLGDTVLFHLDDPSGTVTAGASIGAMALGFAPGLNPPCGVPLAIPGLTVTGNILIGVPAAATLLSATPWAGPGMAVNIAFPLPPNLTLFCPFVGTSLFAQGALLDAGSSNVVLTGAMELVLGG